ncbi:hypothetical protein IGI37_003571 [Enterococcus sp. AZ194]|uniref:hypothetical protein n=1 Tax=Enterococcus sp. AZ194 TaxID=2774629 RepID=UPI003F1F9316
MRVLLISQLHYFYQLLHVRMKGWLLLMFITIITIGVQFSHHPKLSIFRLMFQGTPLIVSQSVPIRLPVLWFIYLFIPIVIVGNSLIELWRNRMVLLRGYQFSKLHFFLVNLVCLLFVALSYVLTTGVLMLLVFHFSENNTIHLVEGVQNSVVIKKLFFELFLNSSLLLLISALFSLISQALSLIIPTFLLVLTPYLSLQINPLNMTMLARYQENTSLYTSFLIGLIMLVTILYYFFFRNKEFY